MAAKITVHIKDPIINITREHVTEDCQCVFLNVRTGPADVVSFHFENSSDMKAFKGLLDFAIES